MPCCWAGGTWLVYALNSNNYSGMCCTIRWFVPLLAPAYFVLAVFLREQPRYRADFLILSFWGILLAGLAWWYGPWIQHMVPLFWPLEAAALLSWIVFRTRQRSATLTAGESTTRAAQTTRLQPAFLKRIELNDAASARRFR